jgi:hypothetical protein
MLAYPHTRSAFGTIILATLLAMPTPPVLGQVQGRCVSGSDGKTPCLSVPLDRPRSPIDIPFGPIGPIEPTPEEQRATQMRLQMLSFANKGIGFFELQEFPRAIQEFNRALPYATTDSTRKIRSWIAACEGYLALQQHKLSLALSKFQEANGHWAVWQAHIGNTAKAIETEKHQARLGDKVAEYDIWKQEE